MFIKFVVSLCVAAVLANVSTAVRITVKNNCRWPLWPATQTGGGGAQLSTTGFMLGPGASRDLEVPSKWTAGRIWARTQCDHPSGRCVTGDCGSGAGNCNGRTGAPPATLAEFTLNDNGKDWYDVSNVDGSNVPMSISPQGGSGPKCRHIDCKFDMNRACPNELAVRTPDGVVGCKSGCEAFRKPELCCSGDNHNTREKCPPSNWSRLFKDKCPDAYSYAYDDPTSLFDCYGAPNYVVTFCP
nr:PREDICTED: thaumatin-like protein 1b [Bemisia tabaci]